MPRRTKIVATLGPATDTDRALTDLIAAGTDLVRVNFSHGVFDDHARRIGRVRSAAARVGRVVGILGDLRGPKVRIERFASGKATLVDGESFGLDLASTRPAVPTRSSASPTRRCRTTSRRATRCS